MLLKFFVKINQAQVSGKMKKIQTDADKTTQAQDSPLEINYYFQLSTMRKKIPSISVAKIQ